MKTKTWKQYALGILLTQSIGALSGWLSRDGMQIFSASISQPPLSPPAFLFPIVWGVLYALMGIGAARIYLSPQSTERSMALNVYITQLIFNFFWSLIFFNAQAYEEYTTSDVKFLATMEHIPTGGVKPTPIIFEIDSMGLTLKGNSHRENYLKQSAPRAGY